MQLTVSNSCMMYCFRSQHENVIIVGKDYSACRLSTGELNFIRCSSQFGINHGKHIDATSSQARSDSRITIHVFIKVELNCSGHDDSPVYAVMPTALVPVSIARPD